MLALYQTASRKLWPIGAAVGLYLAVSLGGTAYAALVQRFVVAPNEQVKETPFILHNIEATRAAFALGDVEERELSGDAALTREDIDENAATLENVPLWDHQPLLDTFGQIQEIRTYYDFVSVDNDRYRHRRRVPAGHAVGARAELRQPAEPHAGSTSASPSPTATA